MRDRDELRVQATAPTGLADSIQPHGPFFGAPAAEWPEPAPRRPAQPAPAHEQVAATSGQLRATYAEYVVDPHTRAVSISIRDAHTDEVINQVPSPELAAMNSSLRAYAQTLALRHAAAQARKRA